MMGGIALTRTDIERALPKVEKGLGKYLVLQAALSESDPASDVSFQRRFNAFYRVRRGRDWRAVFYEALQDQKRSPTSFEDVLRRLLSGTGRVEASFASKLVATVDPSMPVIDSIVLGNVGLRLNRAGSVASRMSQAQDVYSTLCQCFHAYLVSDRGRYLLEQFAGYYPTANITSVKVLDLVLWQTRDNR